MKADGTIWGWGSNTNGRVGIDTATPVIATPTRIDQYINPNNDQRFDLDAETIVDIAAGPDHVLAVDKNGQIYAWGMNNYGQLGISAYKYDSASLPVLVKALSNVFAVKVAAGADYSVVLTDDGYVYSFGNNTRGQLGTADVTVLNIHSGINERCWR